MLGVFFKRYDGEMRLLAVVHSSETGSFSLSKEGLVSFNFEAKRAVNELLKRDDLNSITCSEYFSLGDFTDEHKDLLPFFTRRLTDIESELFRIGNMNGSSRLTLVTEDNIVSAQRYQVAIKGMNDGIWDWNILTDEVYYSPRWKSMLGFEDDELDNCLATWEELMHPEDAAATLKVVTDFLGGKTTELRHTTRFKHKNGGYKTIMCRGSILLGTDGVPLRMIGTHTDITDIIDAKREIESHKELFELAIGASNDGIWEWNFETEELYFSDRWKEMLGYRPHELENTIDVWETLIFEEDKEHALSLVDQHVNGALPDFNVIQRFKHKDGSTVHILSRAKSYRNEQGNVVRMIGAHTDITPTIRAQEAIKKSEEHYRALFENMRLGVMEVDLNGKIVAVYKAFTELTGYSKEELLGKMANDLLVDSDQIPTLEIQQQKRYSGESSTYEIEIKRKNGEKRWCLVSGTPQYDEQCRMVGSIGVHLDISDRKKIESELLAAKQAAELGQRSREVLLANVSHEMRTPLQTIVGFISMMEEKELDNKAKENLSYAKYSSQILHNIISDLLDLNSIQHKRLKLSNEEFDLRMHLMSIDKYYRHIITSVKELSLEFNIPSDLCLRVKGDPFRLHQVLGNLLSNAEKYTKEGKITVDVSYQLQDDKFVMLELEVADTGIGMAEEYIESIFEPFTQLDNRRGPNTYAGIGLGLSIVKEIVKLHNGRINVSSKVGEGSVFNVMLMYRLAESKAEKNNVTTDTTRKLDNKIRILLAEDNTVNRKMTESYFTDVGEHIVTVENGQLAVEYAAAEEFDVILMDINMPVMDGFKAAKLIRNNLDKQTSVVKKPKMVALTASVLRMSPDKLNEYGFDDFIQKPIALSKLHRYCRGEILEISDLEDPGTFNSIDRTIVNEFNDFLRSETLPEHIKGKILFFNKEELDGHVGELENYLLLGKWVQASKKLHYLKSSYSILGIRSVVKGIQSLSEKLKQDKDPENLTLISDQSLLLLNNMRKIISLINEKE